ncbi:MAG: glycosyltransferase [Acidobacteria bacterium]|nr:glycosyltransferase [Acidobacteriota bacterium]
MKISVIICAYTFDRWTALTAAVESCFAQTRPPDEVLVVIDHNEELLERASAEFLKARVIANEMVTGVSGARNTGVRNSSGDVLVFLDDDAYGEEQWLEKLTEPFADSSIAGCGGWLVPHWEGPEPRWFPRTFLWVVGCSYDGLPEDGATIRNPIGANMAIRRDVFTEVGGFIPGMGRIGTVPVGCEETELCIRYGIRNPDKSFVLVRDALAHHRVPEWRCTWSYFFRRCWSEGVSKAATASLVGSHAGLSAERHHVATAMPLEVLSSLRDLASHPSSEARRLTSLLGGAVVTAAGFLRGSLAVRRNPLSWETALLEGLSDSSNPAPIDEWRPVPIVQIDVDAAVEDLDLPEDSNERAWLEVLRGGQVVGRAEVMGRAGRVSAHDVGEVVARYSMCPSSFVSVSDERLPPISIVVPTIYSFPEDFTRFVEVLATMDYPEHEVIVVDNRVAPTSTMPRFDSLKNVTIVEERIPGISAARNRGIRQARYDIIAFTDDDVTPDVRWLRAIGGRLSANPEISAMGGLVLPAHFETLPQMWFEEYFGGFSQSFELKMASLDNHPHDSLFPYAAGHYASGCNMALRKSVLEEVGGFRLTLGTGSPGLGGEDLEMFITIALTGATVAFEPAALVRHSHRRTEDAFLRQVRGYGGGLIAVYTSLLLSDPRHLFRMAPRAWPGYRQLLASRSQRAVSADPSYPKKTHRTEYLGMVYGPLAYLKSWAKFRGLRGQILSEFGESARL